MPTTPVDGEPASDQRSTIIWCPQCSGNKKARGICRHENARIIEVYEAGELIADHYKVLDRIGEGGMGVVYKCLDTNLDKVVALKTLLSERANPELLLRFQREAKLTAKLNHQNLITILNFGIMGGGKPFLVMDFVDGVTLEDYLEKESPPLKELLDIFIQCCKGLAYAHKQGVLHRDLKPSNIMLAGQDTKNVRILDFGIAKLDQDKQFLTHTGALFGTPAYMSPEQCSSQAIDQRSDIYSLGCVLFEALTGQPPFCGDSVLETISMHINAVPPRIHELTTVGKYPRPLDDLVNRTLAKNPRERPASMGKFAEELESISNKYCEPVNEKSVANIDAKPLFVHLLPKESDESKPGAHVLQMKFVFPAAFCLAALTIVIFTQLNSRPPTSTHRIAEPGNVTFRAIQGKKVEEVVFDNNILLNDIEKAANSDKLILEGKLNSELLTDEHFAALLKHGRNFKSIHFHGVYGLTAHRLRKISALNVSEFILAVMPPIDWTLKFQLSC